MPTLDTSSAAPMSARVEVLVLPVFEGPRPGPGVAELQGALGADAIQVLKRHRMEGKVGQTFVLPTLGAIPAESVLFVGLGKESEVGTEHLRQAAMRAARASSAFTSAGSTLHRVGRDERESAQAFAEGVLLGAYRFDAYKAQPIDEASRRAPKLRRVVALGGDRRAVAEGLRRGKVFATAANWARDLVNTPAADATPVFLADQARTMARESGLHVKIWGKAELRRGGFGGILGVGSGSANEPRLIELAYRGDGSAAPIGLSGKGVTFDSGGLSLKEAGPMEWMKSDMSGAAAVLAAMRGAAALQLPVDVVAVVPSSENMPGGSALRPGDVLRHRGGKTSEVLNTDAEGRLILADALAYLSEKKPRAIVDVATLTGAMMVALGDEVWGLLSTDRGLADALLEAARREGEPGWELPLVPEYRRHLESSVADVKNVGQRWGGAIIAALFLKEFVGDVPWAHLDVAGTAFAERPLEYWPKGATGSPTRTLIRFLESQAASGGRPRRRVSGSATAGASSRPRGGRPESR